MTGTPELQSMIVISSIWSHFRKVTYTTVFLCPVFKVDVSDNIVSQLMATLKLHVLSSDLKPRNIK